MQRGWLDLLATLLLHVSIFFHVQTVNKLGAKRAIENLSRQYVHAKRSSTELENVTRGLLRGGTSIPLQGTPQETQQVHIQVQYRIVHIISPWAIFPTSALNRVGL